jgi:hypothetical protein
MSEYTITLATEPSNDHGSDGYVHTTVRVSTAGGTPRIIELSISSGSSNGLEVDDLPPVDLGMLVRAFSFDVRHANLEPKQVAPSKNSVNVRASKASEENRQPRDARTKKEKNVKPDTRTSDDPQARAYRKMPEADKVLTVLEEVGTVTAMAQHFGVPRHTAQGWMQRIRRQSVEGDGKQDTQLKLS